jgi:hypothetical protein
LTTPQAGLIVAVKGIECVCGKLDRSKRLQFQNGERTDKMQIEPKFREMDQIFERGLECSPISSQQFLWQRSPESNPTDKHFVIPAVRECRSSPWF